MTKKYSEEFKKQMVQEYLKGTSYPKLSKEYQVAKSTLVGWVKKYSEECQSTKPQTSPSFSENAKQNGAGGMSAKISPSAVLVIQNGVTKLVNVKQQDPMTKVLDMVPDFVNKFTSKNDVVSEDSAADQTDDAAKSAAGKEMEDILKDSANK